MKKLTVAIVFLTLFVTPGLSAAAEDPYRYQPYRNLEFALMFHQFDYKEDIAAPYKSTEKGWLPGCYISWSLNPKNNLYTKIFMEFSSGDVTYDGTTDRGAPVRFRQDNNQFLFRTELNLGFNFAVSRNVTLTPYTGYGYRYWSRGEAKYREDYQTYNETYWWHYLPIGMKANINLGNQLSIEPNIGFRVMFNGMMTLYLSDLDHRYSDPEFDLGNEIGWFAELPVKIKFSRMWSLVIKPWYEHSKIGKSNYVDVYNGSEYETWYEPSSRTNQYGINVGVVFTY